MTGHLGPAVRGPREPVLSAAVFNQGHTAPGRHAKVSPRVFLLWEPVRQTWSRISSARPDPAWAHADTWPQWRGLAPTRGDSLFALPFGAPAALALLEVVAAAGAREVVVVGACGSLREQAPDLVVPSGATTVTATALELAYPADGVRGGPTPGALDAWPQDLAGRGYQVAVGEVQSTDFLFREYREDLREWAAAGRLAVDMECAALFQAARDLGVDLSVVLCVTDVLAGPRWRPRAPRGSLGAVARDLLSVLVPEQPRE
jgi:hypothetical protein